MKIHATRIPEPRPGVENGTAWRVAVTYDDGRTETVRRVRVIGSCSVIALPDTEPGPHVYVKPDADAHVLAEAENGDGLLLQTPNFSGVKELTGDAIRRHWTGP